jgi:hypothetical protein
LPLLTSPYGPYGASQVSPDSKIAFATFDFGVRAQDLPDGAVNAVIHTARAARRPNLKVELTGQAIENAQPQQSSNSTALGAREAWVRTGGNRAAVTTGQAVTGRVITAAASIKILVSCRSRPATTSSSSSSGDSPRDQGRAGTRHL